MVSVGLAFFCGTIFGCISGYYKGRLDNIIMRGMDIILSFPYILLAIVVVAYLGPSLQNAMIAIAITYVPRFARIVRGSVLEECEKDYVTAARAIGARDLRIIFIAILPNCLGPLIVQTTLSFASAILDAAALSFLGLGAQPPTPEWGADDRPQPRPDPEGLLGDDLSGAGHPGGRARVQPLGRRLAGRAGSAAEGLTPWRPNPCWTSAISGPTSRCAATRPRRWTT